MVDELQPTSSKGGEPAEEHSLRTNSIQQSRSREHENTSPASPAPLSDTEPAPAQGLRRYGTMPVRRWSTTNANGEDTGSPATRRRGRTISSRPRDVPQATQLSPRSQLFGRNPSNAGGAGDREMMGSIPERGRPSLGSPRPPRRSTLLDNGEFVSPGLRARNSTLTGRPRGSTVNRRPSVAVAAVTSGREQDGQSVADFTMAGPAVNTVEANQAYVDPGYAQLNPAYDQPVNNRPVWGLAKPLPRVIRPGMVPSRSEINIAPLENPQPPDSANADLEQGRIEPTLNVNKLSSQLQNTREQRENNLIRKFSNAEGPPVTNAGRRPSSLVRPLSAPSEAVIEEEEEEDVGLQPLEPNEQSQAAEQNKEEQTTPPSHWYPDDAASAITEHEQDGDLDGDWIQREEIPLPAYDAENDEIHNLHTHWSVIRLRFREPLAELLAVTVQLTLGFCADLSVATSDSKAGNGDTTDWAWGLATMVGIYIAGGISGAHLNPAISLMLYIYRGFPLHKIPIYVLAQILGAFLAGLIAFGLYQKDIIAYGGADLANGGTLASFITFPRYDWIDAGTAFFTEFTGTAILAVAVLALGDDTNAPPGAGMNAFILGLVVTVCSMAFSYNTGAAMNPSRDLGPRLAVLAVGYGGEVFRNGYWIYGPWAATVSGAIFGAFLYDAAIFVGGESPVNYPRRRMKRAGRKWRRKWGARLKGYRRRIGRRGDFDDGGSGNWEKMENGKKVNV